MIIRCPRATRSRHVLNGTARVRHTTTIVMVRKGDLMKAVVTGGSRGIGRAIVEELVRNGYQVTFTYNSREQEAAELVSSLGADKVSAVKCAITDANDVNALYEKVCGTDGSVDLLVNNAGVTKDNYFALMGMDAFETVIDTNLVGSARVTQRFIKKMVAKSGRSSTSRRSAELRLKGRRTTREQGRPHRADHSKARDGQTTSAYCRRPDS